MHHPSIQYDIEDDVKDLSVQEKYNRRLEEAVPLSRHLIACAGKIIGDSVQHKPARNALKYLLY
jgi:hypothetical protein